MSTKIQNVVYRASWSDEISANFESVSFFNSHRRLPQLLQMAILVLAYLKYVHAASATKRIAMIQRDELFIPVFLAMDRILSLLLIASGNLSWLLLQHSIS